MLLRVFSHLNYCHGRKRLTVFIPASLYLFLAVTSLFSFLFLFIFGCAGLLLHGLFSGAGELGLLFDSNAWASLQRLLLLQSVGSRAHGPQ